MNLRRRALCAALAAAAVLAVGCPQQNEYQPPPPPTVTVSPPVRQTVTLYLEETGTTEAVRYVDIRARVKGFLQTIQFEPNDDVEEGQLLYTIDPAPFDAVLKQQEAARDIAITQFQKADADFRRGQQLVPNGTITRQEFDQLTAERGVKEANIKAAEAAVTAAQLDLGYTKVVSPINGVVAKTLVYEGNLVGASEATHLTTVVQYNPIFASFNISERALLTIRKNAARDRTGDVKKEDVKMFLRRGTDATFDFAGHLDYWDLAVDESTGTYRIRGIFENPDRELVPGLFVRVRLPIGSQEDALLIPERAVAEDQAGKYLLVVGDDQKVERRDVTLGVRKSGYAVVEKGLLVTDRVVIDGIQRARPGAEVTAEDIKLLGPEEEVTVVEEGSGPRPEDASTEGGPGAGTPPVEEDPGPGAGGDATLPADPTLTPEANPGAVTPAAPAVTPPPEPSGAIPVDPTVTPPAGPAVTPPAGPAATTPPPGGPPSVSPIVPSGTAPADPNVRPPTPTGTTPPAAPAGAPSLVPGATPAVPGTAP